MDTKIHKSLRQRPPVGSATPNDGLLEVAWAELARLRSLDPREQSREIGNGIQSWRFTFIDGEYLSPEGAQALHQWADTVRTNRNDLERRISKEAWKQVVQMAFVEVFREQATTLTLTGDALEVVSANIVQKSLAAMRERELTLVHYLPCYLFDDPQASPIVVGPVRFVRVELLTEQLAQDLETRPAWFDSLEALKRGELTEDSLSANHRLSAKVIREHEAFPWSAVVRVEGRETRNSRETAIKCARLAIAGLSLFARPGEKGRQSLAYEWPHARRKTVIMVIPGKDLYPGQENDLPQIAGVLGTIDEFMAREKPFLDWLGQAIGIAMLDTALPAACRSLRMAWLNAVYWFYAGGLEAMDARAVICYSSCLESLANGMGKNNILSLLKNLLGAERNRVIVNTPNLTLEDGIERIYGDARSAVVHGGRFVLNEDFDFARYLAASIAREALFKFQRRLVEYEEKYVGHEAADRKDAFLRYADSRMDFDRNKS